MMENEDDKGRKKANSDNLFTENGIPSPIPQDKNTVTGILDERIENLKEAIAEIDAALAGRKKLNIQFLEQIDREAEEVKHHLNALQPPWRIGYETQYEFYRLSLHKSLTSRAKERRGEELKYWENGVNLQKERRKFLDELKALVATKRRLKVEKSSLMS